MYDLIAVGGSSVDVFVRAKNEIIKHNGHEDFAFHKGSKILIDELIIGSGGSGSNVACAIRELGLKSGFIGVVGDDGNGKIILEDLKNYKVDFLGKQKKGISGYSVILAGGDDRTILVYKGINNNLEVKDVDFSKLNSRWLYVSTLLGKSFDTTLKLIDYAFKKGIKIGFNPSVYLCNKGIKELAVILKKLDLLVINKEEAFTLSGENDIKEAINQIKKYTSGIIAITDGANKIHVFSNGKLYIKKVKKTKVADLTGAGDAFSAGFIYGLIKNKDISTCIEYGHRNAASAIKEIGAKTGLLKKM